MTSYLCSNKFCKKRVPHTMVERARLHSNLSDLPHKKHKLLDLSNVERYERFNCHKFVFKVQSQPITITTHSSSTPQEVQREDLALETVLKDGLDIMEAHHIPSYAVIHIYVLCEGLEQDFKFCGAGANRVTLNQMRAGKLSDTVTRFSHITQSGSVIQTKHFEVA